jgi:NitT/TauT family transport system substrate-binding protein
MNRSARIFLAISLALCAGTTVFGAAAAETVNFGTDWKAEAEHGGFYQAIATGIYQRHGLEVNLRPGGPQVNHAQLLAAGVLDFNIASNSFVPLNFARENIPMVAVAAIFQKDPSVLIAHPGQGNDSLAQLKGKPIMIGSTRGSPLAVPEAEIRPHRRPDPALHLQRRAVPRRPEGDPAGLRDERGLHHREGGRQPVVMLLADAGTAAMAR